MRTIPYLTFDGNAEEAMNFYKDALSGEIQYIHRFSSMPNSQLPAEMNEKIMHASIKFGSEGYLQFSDTVTPVGKEKKGFSIVLLPDSEEQIDEIYFKLSKDATVLIPLALTFWNAKYGKLVDKFGVMWDLNFEFKK